MKKLICFFLILPSLGFAQNEVDIPVKVDEIGEKVAIFRVEDNPGATNVIVISTKNGLVVIDTGMSEKIAESIRKSIINKFNRDDFLYIINTHHHWDHTMGNQAFKDVAIIGHELCAEEIDKFNLGKDNFVKQLQEGWIDVLKEQLKEMDINSDEANITKKRILYSSMVCNDLNTGLGPLTPSIRFNDCLTLYSGDISLILNYHGANHSNTDILIYVPEEKLLIVGDQFGNGSIPYIDENTNISKLLKTINILLEEENKISHIIRGHGDLISLSNFREYVYYIDDMWKLVKEKQRNGFSLEEIKKNFSFKLRYKHLSHLRHTWSNGTDYHLLNIENIWKMKYK